MQSNASALVPLAAAAWCWDIRARLEPYLGISTFQLHGLEQAFAGLQFLLSPGRVCGVVFPFTLSKDLSLKRMHKRSL